MSLGGGYVNRVAWIDLTGGQIEYKPIAEEDARKYIGTAGWGSSTSSITVRRWNRFRPTTSCAS